MTWVFSLFLVCFITLLFAFSSSFLGRNLVVTFESSDHGNELANVIGEMCYFSTNLILTSLFLGYA